MLEKGCCLNHVYTLIEEIGSGGGGIVYKAYHENLKKYVILKQIKDIAKGVLDRRAEADILKNLRNSYLPQVYDFIEADGETFTVIDYIEGESLDKVLLRKKCFGQQEVLKWARQLANALAYLHSQTPPIIHSDIKPANIMLTPKGDICLIDFNVSLAFQEKAGLAAGISKSYSPPEQYRSYSIYCTMTGIPPADTNRESDRKTEYVPFDGDAPVEQRTSSMNGKRLTEAMIGRGVDERSDIYSLGATLYHLLTGVCPAEDFDKIVPIDSYPSIASEGFIFIIKKMMELDPEKRYQNGSEAERALKEIYKLDSVYQNYKRKHLLGITAIVSLYVLSGGLMVVGVLQMSRESNNLYNSRIEEAGRYIAASDFENAEKIIQEALKQKPERVDAYTKEIQRLYEAARYEECIAYGRESVNSPAFQIRTENDKKNLGDILYIMGNAYYEQKDYDNAINCLERAISYNDSNSNYFLDLGLVFAQSGNVKHAKEILNRSSEYSFPQDAILMLKGELAFTDGNFLEAVQYFQEAMNFSSTDTQRNRCILLCAKAYDQLGPDYLETKIAFLEQWRDLSGIPSGQQIKEKLAEAYAENGEFEKSILLFREVSETGYQTYSNMSNLVILYQQTDQFEQAKVILEQMNEQYPDRYETWKRLAFLEADLQQHKPNKQRDYSKMKEYYEKAAALYQKQDNQDSEMLQLENMLQELQEGNWF